MMLITTLVVTVLVCCVLEVGCGKAGVCPGCSPDILQLYLIIVIYLVGGTQTRNNLSYDTYYSVFLLV